MSYLQPMYSALISVFKSTFGYRGDHILSDLMGKAGKSKLEKVLWTLHNMLRSEIEAILCAFSIHSVLISVFKYSFVSLGCCCVWSQWFLGPRLLLKFFKTQTVQKTVQRIGSMLSAGSYLININVIGRFQNEFLLNKSNRFTKCICRSKEAGWRK